MSQEFNEIPKKNEGIYISKNDSQKDILEIQKSVKNIETKIILMEKVLNELFEVINNITIFIDDAEDIRDEDLDDEEDWTPYDERNFQYEDDNDEEDIGGDNYWSSHEDES